LNYPMHVWQGNYSEECMLFDKSRTVFRIKYCFVQLFQAIEYYIKGFAVSVVSAYSDLE